MRPRMTSPEARMAIVIGRRSASIRRSSQVHAVAAAMRRSARLAKWCAIRRTPTQSTKAAPPWNQGEWRTAATASGAEGIVTPSISAVKAVGKRLAAEGVDLGAPRARDRREREARFERAADVRVADQDVDRQPVGDVLVRRLLPREPVAVLRDDVLQERQRRDIRPVCARVRDVYLEAVAGLPGELVEGRLEGV